MEELVVKVKVIMSIESQTLTLLEVPTVLSALKPLEALPHFDTIFQLMGSPPFLVHWYETTSQEHTGPGPISCVD